MEMITIHPVGACEQNVSVVCPVDVGRCCLMLMFSTLTSSAVVHGATDPWAHWSKTSHCKVGHISGLKGQTHTLLRMTPKQQRQKAATAAKSLEMKTFWNTWYYSIVPINVSVQAANEMLTLDPPANTRCLVLHTNMPPFSTSFLQWRKAKPLNKCRISPSRPYSRNTNTHTDWWTG